jgi:hypothetical protein
MKGNDLNKQFEALKRAAVDLVREMHARKLAIPAGALLLAIVAAVMLLPSSSTPPPAPPTATAPVVKAPKVERVAQVSLIEPASLDEDIPLSTSGDPFTGAGGSYDCVRVGSGTPKTYDCEVSDLKVRIVCTSSSGGGPCAESSGAGAGGTGGGGAAGGGAGATSGTGGSGEPVDSGGGNDSTGKSTTPKDTYYTVSTSLDGTTSKDVLSGDELPDAAAPLVIYAGTNDAHNKAVFLAADGVSVSGVPVDATFGSFTLKKSQTATLTDANGATHKLTLKSISKVTK